MANIIKLPRGSIMRWNGTDITEHNRSSLSIDVERIEKKQRMANGTLRKYVIGDKRSFSTSWENLPHSANYTVDGKWGGSEIETFYNSMPGSFTLTVQLATGLQNYTVMFSEFSKKVNRRGRSNIRQINGSFISYDLDLWDINITLEEV